MSDFVSVLIPAYNAEATVGDALASVLAQTHAHVEAVVVDDGSSDGTLETAQSYADAHPGRVRVLTQQNAGACAARNHALAESSAPFVKFLDADDVLTPDAVEVQLRALSLHDTDERVSVYGDLLVADPSLRVKRRQPGPGDIGAASAAPVERVVALLSRNIQTSLPLHRRKWLVEVGGFRTHLRRAQEYDLHLRLALAGVQFVHVAHVCTHLRLHNSPDRISNTSPMLDDPEGYLDVIRERREIIEGALGQPLPEPIAETLARGIWKQMRRLVQAGHLEAARRYAAEAHRLDPRVRQAGPLFQLLSTVGGPVGAERVLIQARRLTSSIGTRPS